MTDDTISRQMAIDVLGKIFPADPMRNDYTKGITCGAALATEYIKQLPSAVDAVEVVRCNDCKYWDFSDIHSSIFPSRRCKAIIGKMYTNADFYCAFAERRQE